MPRADLAVTECTSAGVAPAETAGQADGHMFKNTSQEILVIRNTGAGSHNVTIQTPQTVDGLAVADQVNAVAAGATEFMGPFKPPTYNQSDGKVYVDYDAAPAELMVRVLKVPKL